MEYLCFMQDSMGKHYMLPVSLRNEFDDDVDDNLAECEFDTKYEMYRSLHPCNYMFTERIILKNL